MKFNCWECGACCKTVGIGVENAKKLPEEQITPLIREVINFPHRYDLSGRCSKLGLDNKCEIYDTRPDICNTTMVYGKYLKDRLTEEEYAKMAEETCRQLDDIMKDF